MSDAYLEKNFKESSSSGLERLVRTALKELPWMVQKQRLRKEEHEERDRRYREDELRRQEREQRERERREREEALWGAFKRWNKAERLRQFIDDAEKARARAELPGDLGTEEWCLWAKSIADRIDPLVARGS